MEQNWMPKVVNDDGELEYFDTWKVQLTKIIPQDKEAINLEDYTILNTSIDGMTKVEIEMDVFIKEARILINDKYN